MRELLLNATERIDEHFADRPELEAGMRDTISSALYFPGRYDEGESQARLALALRRRELGEDHRDTLRNMGLLGRISAHQGRAAEAVALIREAYESNLRSLGPNDQATRKAAGILASMLVSVSRYGEAETLLRRLLELPEGVGDDHLQNAASAAGDLAEVLTYQVKLREGESFARRAVSRPLSEGPGTVIGHYKLLQLIGQGGFGAVYMAEQKEPLRRKVALKVIKIGMDTQRFSVPPLVQRGGRGYRTQAGDSWGQRLILRGNGTKWLSRRHRLQDWHDGAANQARIAARDIVSACVG